MKSFIDERFEKVNTLISQLKKWDGRDVSDLCGMIDEVCEAANESNLPLDHVLNHIRSMGVPTYRIPPAARGEVLAVDFHNRCLLSGSMDVISHIDTVIDSLMPKRKMLIHPTWRGRVDYP